MEFGVPSKRRVAQDKYPNIAVITLLPFEGENTSRKIEFNKKAYEVLGLKKDDTNDVAFSFNKSNFTDNSIINANGFGMDAALNLAKNKKISNKAHYEELKNRYGASLEEELELTLVDSGKEFRGNKVFKLVTLSSHEEAMKPRAEKIIEDSNKHALADDEMPENPIKNHGGQGVAPGSVEERPDDETVAKMDEDDLNAILGTNPNSNKAVHPWEENNQEDDLI